ncbi:MAG: hemerythrin family protein [Gammaproteobacteria bacterium]|nr:hemerythrin family protein [Gammaproteobacteria bacterium]
MSLIHWDDNLSIGVKSVDEQHKRLVEIINKLNDALVQGQANDVLGEVLSDVADYTVMHFAYEESLFEKYNYPDKDKHIQSHKDLIASVQNLQEKLQQDDFMVGVETMTFLKEWLTGHILKVDKAFSAHMIEHGVE